MLLSKKKCIDAHSTTVIIAHPLPMECRWGKKKSILVIKISKSKVQDWITHLFFSLYNILRHLNNFILHLLIKYFYEYQAPSIKMMILALLPYRFVLPLSN